MDDRHGVGAARELENDSVPSRANGNPTVTVREFLSPDESLRLVDTVSYLYEGRHPAVVGLTDDRLLLVVEDDRFVGLGLDRVCTVRSNTRTSFDVRGLDYRLLVAVGCLLAVVGLAGVVGTAGNPLSPPLALVTLLGALGAERIARERPDPSGALASLLRHDGALAALNRRDGMLAALTRHERELALGVTSALGAGGFVVLAATESEPATPFFTVLLLVGAGLAVYASHNSERFEAMELVRSRRRTVTLTVEDGSTVRLRTSPDSPLDRELARLGQSSATGQGDGANV